MKAIVVAAMSMSVLVGCGRANVSKVSADKEFMKPLLVVLGGNASCEGRQSPIDMPMYQRFLDLKQTIDTEIQADSDYIISCYENAESTVYATTSLSPDETIEGNSKTVAQMMNQQFADRYPVFLVGYSYGGWLALQTALEANENLISSVYTVDPISRKYCNALDFSDCTRFPSDVTSSQRQYIANSSEKWVNYYQTVTYYLHSAPTGQADDNKRVGTSHFGIQTHSNIWSMVEADVKSRLFQ
ncbi:MAG: hypothetical protein AB7T49_04930 [Oligoflexales bacterium]